MGLGISVQSFMSFHCTQWKSWFLLIPHCPEQSHFFLSFLLIAEKIHPNMKSLPAPDHPVLLCCACSSMSGPSSHLVAQTGHNTQVQHHRWGGKTTPFIFWVHICSQFSMLGSCLCYNSTWTAYVQPALYQNPPCLFCRAAVTAQPVLSHLFPLRCRPCTYLIWKSQGSCQPAEGPLNSSLAFQCNSSTAPVLWPIWYHLQTHWEYSPYHQPGC